MSLKKYRITKVDGNVEIIEATNLEEAVSRARSKYGQLPNDVNLKIISNLVKQLADVSKNIDDGYDSIRKGAKELDWDSVYTDAHKVIDSLNSASLEIKTLVGSMVKLNKEEGNE